LKSELSLERATGEAVKKPLAKWSQF